uniref:Putative chemotaxis response regulator n=1 Tax=Magnetococcus massalia (strain MO-1) TaxID=451514 RepID=A0A1S7LE34_MAGMO|nr:Putative chemotaxis response regulator [Candidatus Magnetococcus massalia]
MIRVLSIDDCTSIQMLIRQILEKGQIEVLTAEDGQQALELLQSESVDLIITDIEMTVMDGWAFIQSYRQQERGGITPIMVLSSSKPTLQQTTSLNISAWQKKPFSARQLRTMVYYLLWDHERPESEKVLQQVMQMHRTIWREKIVCRQEREVISQLSDKLNTLIASYSSAEMNPHDLLFMRLLSDFIQQRSQLQSKDQICDVCSFSSCQTGEKLIKLTLLLDEIIQNPAGLVPYRCDVMRDLTLSQEIGNRLPAE